MRETRSLARRRAGSLAAAGLATLSLVLGACGSGTAPGASPTAAMNPSSSPEAGPMATQDQSPNPAPFTLTSPAFADGAPIPAEHSCRGADVSPALVWRGVPAGTSALVLFVDDPDGGDWVHWSVLDLPGVDGELPRGVAPSTEPPQQGRNDFRRIGYGGPCPPSGNHHYRFTLHALAAPLGLAGHPDGSAVRAALARATILGKVTLVGTFKA